MCNISTSTDAIMTHSTETLTEVRHKINNNFNKNENRLGVGLNTTTITTTITNATTTTSCSNNAKKSTNIINNSQLYSISSYNLFSSSSSSYSSSSSPSSTIIMYPSQPPPKKPPRMKSSSSILLPPIPELHQYSRYNTASKSSIKTITESRTSLPITISSRLSPKDHNSNTSPDTSPDLIVDNSNQTTNAMTYDGEFINSEFYIDESLPSSFEDTDDNVADNNNSCGVNEINCSRIKSFVGEGQKKNELLSSLRNNFNYNDDDGGDEDGGGNASSHCDSQTVILLLQVHAFEEIPKRKFQIK